MWKHRGNTVETPQKHCGNIHKRSKDALKSIKTTLQHPSNTLEKDRLEHLWNTIETWNTHDTPFFKHPWKASEGLSYIVLQTDHHVRVLEEVLLQKSSGGQEG